MLDSGGNQIDPRVAKTWVNAVVRTFTADRIPTCGVLIRASVPGQRLLPRLDPTHGWGALFEGGVEIVDAPGDHFSLILNEQNVEITALRIRGLLDRRLRSNVKAPELALAGKRP